MLRPGGEVSSRTCKEYRDQLKKKTQIMSRKKGSENISATFRVASCLSDAELQAERRNGRQKLYGSGMIVKTCFEEERGVKLSLKCQI